jgi:hypothetical protein
MSDILTKPEMTWAELDFYAQLRGYADKKGYSDGWAWHTFRDKFGFPPNCKRAPRRRPPDRETMTWIKGHTEAFKLRVSEAEAKAAQAAAIVQPATVAPAQPVPGILGLTLSDAPAAIRRRARRFTVIQGGRSD